MTQRMVTAVAVALVCASVAAARRGRGHNEPNEEPVCPPPRVACKKWAPNPDGFNYFAFQQSWSSEFCYGKSLTAKANEARYPNCALSKLPLCDAPTPYMCNALTIHGLWATAERFQPPQHGPYCCSEGADFNSALFVGALKTDLNTYWPDEATTDSPASDPTTGDSGFHEYEWDKHGMCSAMDQTQFFETAISIHKRLPTPFRSPWCGDGSGARQDGMTLNQQTGVYTLRVNVADAEAKYTCAPYSSTGGEVSQQCVVFGCTKGFLSDITTCWGDTNNDGVLDQIACGPSVTTVPYDQECHGAFNVMFFPNAKCTGGAKVPCPP